MTRHAAVLARSAILLGGAIGPIACRKDSRPVPAADSAVAAAPVAALPPDGTLPPDPCPLIGDWKPCNVHRRLKEAGLVVVPKTDAPLHPLAGIADAVYTVGEGPAELHVWIFPDTTARAAALAILDTMTAMPRGSSARWPRPPTMISSINLLAVMVSDNDRLAERVALALGAGMPAR